MKDCTMNVSTDPEIVNEEKDLGVWCKSDLKPSLHCHRAAVRATQVLGLIRRSFKINSVDMFVFLMYTWNIVYNLESLLGQGY